MALFARANATKCSFINNCSNKLTVINAESRKFCGFSTNCLAVKRSQVKIRPTAAFSKQRQSSTATETYRDFSVGEGTGLFDKFISLRRDEAKRSVIIQVQSPDSYADLYTYCHGFGRINSIQYYVVAKSTHFFIIEFQEMSSQIALINAATHLNHAEIIPVQSQMLWFRNISMRKKPTPLTDIPKLPKYVGTPSETAAIAAFAVPNSISEQMKILYKMWKIDDVGIRLRFLTVHQMESSFSSLFPNISVLPFGSSVNGFGKKGCDLDLVLNLETSKCEKAGSRLVFHTKSATSQEREQTQRSMETISTVIKHFVPGIVNVTNILQARVPIIKYDHKITGLECDLSMTNLAAFYMSELLYLYGEFHPNVRPLIFTIRQWASSVEITNPVPGTWITNFSLSLLVLFYLQCEKILPSLDSLRNDASSSDVRLTGACVDCTFLRDISKWSVEHRSTDSLESWLAGFFNFYANFDFTTKAISLRDGASLYKPMPSPLYICNPLEKTLNVSKNVSSKELMKFINAVRGAAILMDKPTISLLDLFKWKQSDQNPILQRHKKKIRISDLFEPNNISGNKTTTAGGEKKLAGQR